MASLDLGALRIAVEVNNADAVEKLNETEEAVSSVSEKGSGKLASFAKGAGVAFAAVGTATVAAAKGLWDVANSAASTADAIDKTS